MSIVIVAPQYKDLGHYYELPLGLAYISANLKRHGYPVSFVNENEARLKSNFREIFRDAILSADILMTGGLSVHFDAVLDIIQRAKEIKPDIKVIAGGGLISSEPEIMAEAFNLNHAIVGEGEEAVIDLLMGRVTDKIVYAKPIEDLDTLPFPDYDALGVRDYLGRQLCGDEYYTYPEDRPRILPIISSRSCPYNCSFCYHPLGRKYRQRSIENFADEVKHLKTKYQVNMLAILDELISVNHDRLAAICKVMSKEKLKWMTQMRVTGATREILKMMKDSGCYSLSLGIEHVSEPVLKSMHKHITREEIEHCLALCAEVGIGIQGNILFGDPAETQETVREALEWTHNNLRYGINLTYVIPFPGSKLYQHHLAEGNIKDRLDYIVNGCQFIPKYVRPYMAEIEKTRPGNRLWSHDVVVKPTRVDAHRGQLYDVRLRCHHCGLPNEYINLYTASTGTAFLSGQAYRIGCRHCHQRTDFNLV